MSKLHNDAICIRQWDWSETSQTVSLFTRELGVVRALAKGAKRPKANFSGGMELLTRGEAGLILKPASDLALLTSWDLRQTFPALRSSLAAHRAGLYMADLVQHFVRDHDPHTRLFDELLVGLTGLAAQERIAAAVLRFQWSTLVEAGFHPVVPDPSEGGTPEPRVWSFSPGRGGIVPSEETVQRPSADAHHDGTEWRVRSETVGVLRELQSGRGISGNAPAEAVSRATRLMAAYIRHTLGAEPPTQRWVVGSNLPK